ncbi:MAG: hypothetical protein ACQEVA_17685 [Myxococcota bacterium]
MRRFGKIALAVVMSMALGVGAGCGPEEGNNGNNLPNSNTDGGLDAGDTTDDGSGDDGTTDDTDDGTTEDVDEGDGIIGQSCEARPEDLGTLAVGDSLDLEREFRVRPEGTESSCAEPETRAGVYVLEMVFEETSKIQLGLFASAASSPVMEMRAGECLERGMPEFCGEQPSRTAVVEPNTSYYIFIQGSADSEAGDFRLTVDVQEAACGPSDEVCQDGAQQFCPSGDQLETRSCVNDTCGSTEACTGETCTEAIPVDLSASASQTFTGGRYAYANDWNALDRANCALDDTGPGGDTPQEDIFFEVSGHSQGDNVVFNAEEGQTNFGFFILDACDAPGCIDAGAAADPLAPNEFSWRATTADPIYVVADVLGPRRDRSFEITITLE